MADIATIWDTALGQGDWALSPSRSNLIIDNHGASIIDYGGVPLTDALTAFTPGQGLLAGGDLQTAVLISLFTDATADPDDVLPDATEDPRGWWAAAIGSKIWLRLRAKQTDQLLVTVRNDVQAALQWLIEDEVAAKIDVVTEWSRPGMLGCSITITRTNGAAVPLRFDWAWKEI